MRGICALLVALFHLKSAGLIADLALVRKGWLFVDFFFVLSGFVIAASYGVRLRSWFSVARFMAWIIITRNGPPPPRRNQAAGHMAPKMPAVASA